MHCYYHSLGLGNNSYHCIQEVLHSGGRNKPWRGTDSLLKCLFPPHLHHFSTSSAVHFSLKTCGCCAQNCIQLISLRNRSSASYLQCVDMLLTPHTFLLSASCAWKSDTTSYFYSIIPRSEPSVPHPIGCFCSYQEMWVYLCAAMQSTNPTQEEEYCVPPAAAYSSSMSLRRSCISMHPSSGPHDINI